MGQPVIHFEITGKDCARLQSYYSDLFGWQIDADNLLGYGSVTREANAEGAGIGGGIGGVPPGVPGHVTVYVEVADVEAALTKAEHLGGTRILGPAEVTAGVELGLFKDPEGNLLGLLKARPQAG
jgi:uncharacterized protein